MEVFPNPADESATFRFTAVDDGEVQIRIFDTNGQEVAKAVHQETRADETYELKLATQDLAEGMYYYNLETGGHYQASGKLSIAR